MHGGLGVVTRTPRPVIEHRRGAIRFATPAQRSSSPTLTQWDVVYSAANARDDRFFRLKILTPFATRDENGEKLSRQNRKKPLYYL
jgi:hypothetical protein